jgi:hypothetical protein
MTNAPDLFICAEVQVAILTIMHFYKKYFTLQSDPFHLSSLLVAQIVTHRNFVISFS